MQKRMSLQKKLLRVLCVLAAVVFAMAGSVLAAGVGKVTIKSTSVSANAVKLTWKKVSGVSGYRIYSLDSAGTAKLVASPKKTATNYTVKKLKTGTTYRFYMTAYKGTEESEPSKVVSATPYVKGLEAPTNLTVSNNANSVKLTWQGVSGASGYEVFQKNSSGTFVRVKTVTGRTATIKKLTAGESYTFKIRTYKKSGNSKLYGSYSREIVGKPYGATSAFSTIHGYYYSGKMKETVTVGGYKFKKNKTYTFTEVSGKTYTALVGGKTYQIPKGKVTVKGLITNYKKNYSKELAEQYVNAKGYVSSTKYLIWVSSYTQHLYVFQGSQYNWKLVQKYICSTGTGEHRSKQGIGYVGNGRKVEWWFDKSQLAYYCTSIPGGYIHSWLYNPAGERLGGVYGRIGYPASHGCVRLEKANAKWVFDHIPTGTTYVFL